MYNAQQKQKLSFFSFFFFFFSLVPFRSHGLTFRLFPKIECLTSTVSRARASAPDSATKSGTNPAGGDRRERMKPQLNLLCTVWFFSASCMHAQFNCVALVVSRSSALPVMARVELRAGRISCGQNRRPVLLLDDRIRAVNIRCMEHYPDNGNPRVRVHIMRHRLLSQLVNSNCWARYKR